MYQSEKVCLQLSQAVRGGFTGFRRRRNMAQDSWSVPRKYHDLQRLVRRDIKNCCDLNPDHELVGLWRAVANFSEYETLLGSDL